MYLPISTIKPFSIPFTKRLLFNIRRRYWWFGSSPFVLGPFALHHHEFLFSILESISGSFNIIRTWRRCSVYSAFSGFFVVILGSDRLFISFASGLWLREVFFLVGTGYWSRFDFWFGVISEIKNWCIVCSYYLRKEGNWSKTTLECLNLFRNNIN